MKLRKQIPLRGKYLKMPFKCSQPLLNVKRNMSGNSGYMEIITGKWFLVNTKAGLSKIRQ
jgi:hypothetical protein